MYRDRRQYTILRLKDQIWRERRFLILVIVVLCALVFYQRWAGGLYALKVDRVVVVWAKSRKAADELVQMVKQRQSGGIAPGVATRFAEELEIRREKFTGEDIPDLQRGVERLLPHLSLVVRGSVVVVDGGAVVGVPSRETAELVLKEVKRSLGPVGAGGELVEERFKEKVEIEPGEVPAAMFRGDREEAVDLLTGKGDSGAGGKPALTLVTVMHEWERGSGGGSSLPARLVKVTYENGKEIGREPLE